MNRDTRSIQGDVELTNLWEAARDGDLTPQQRQAFEARLAADASLRALWESENDWLDALQEPAEPGHAAADDAAFVSQVVDRWQAREQAAVSQDADEPAVIGRIGWRLHAVALGCAAVLMLVVVGSFWFPAQAPSPGPNVIAVQDGPHPLRQLLDTVNDTARLASEKPAGLFSRFERPVMNEAFTSRLTDLLPALPDPAELFADPPTDDASRSDQTGTFPQSLS